MKIDLTPLNNIFGAKASGIDLSQPLDAQNVRAINSAMREFGVLVWRGQTLTAQEQIKFATSFGPIDIGLKRVFKRAERLEDERLIDISNVAADGKIAGRDSQKILSNYANQLWHSDSSFMNPRAAYSMLSCIIKPSWGADTEFVDLRHAYDTLDDRTKTTLQGLEAEHFALHTRLLLGDDAYTDEQKKEIPPAIWPLVQTQHGTDRKVLFVGVHARRIMGWPIAESRIFLLDLLEHATRPENIYTHHWEIGDLVMWDNRITLHRGRRFDINERREMRRTTINDTAEAMLECA